MADELILGADRDLHRHRLGAEAVDHRLDGVEEVGAGAVHLVDERDARHGVLVGLAPDRLGLRLHACDRVEQRDRAVQHAQGALDLDGKVHVPGRVDDVDAVITPETGGRGRRDRDAALLLLHHPVHRRGTLVHLAQLVVAAGVVEDPLGGGGLAGVDVGHDADVADAVELVHLRHAAAGLCLCHCHVCVTTGSGRRPCWPAPFGRCRPSSCRRRPAGWRRPGSRRRASRASPSRGAAART